MAEQIKNNTARKDKLILRYCIFLAGLFVASLGVAFSTQAGLGTSPVASVPYSVSLVNHALSFGTWLNILSLLQITAQVMILKGEVEKLEIAIQTILAFAFGYMTDFSVFLIRGIVADNYVEQFVCMLVGCFVLALGIWIQLKGGVAMLPGEALYKAISQVSGWKYADIKVAGDIIMIAAAAGICLIFLGRLEGVREGSVIAAIAVGNIIKLINGIVGYCQVKIKTR